MTLDVLEQLIRRICAGTTPPEAAVSYQKAVDGLRALRPNFELTNAPVWVLALTAKPTVESRVVSAVLPYDTLTHTPSLFGGILLFKSRGTVLAVQAFHARLVPGSPATED